MKRSTKAAFESKYGFLSPGFRVDSEGNVTARSLSVSTGGGEDPVNAIYDFTVTDDEANFSIENLAGVNPSISLNRGTTYTFRLNLTGFRFFIKRSNGTTNQVGGLVHSDGDTGVDAQGKSSGILSFTVPLDADDTLFYSNLDGSAIGTITVLDPTGLFSNISVTGGIQSTSTTSGSLVIDGGVGISDDLYIGGELNLGGVGIPKLSSETNLELNAKNKIIIQVDSVKLGEINSTGLAIPINNSNISESTINNTIIGNTTPSSATFTSATFTNATVTNTATNRNDVTNKSYVDLTSAALAIALGS